MTARLPWPVIDLATKVQHDAADPLKQLLVELGGSALPVVPVDPEYAQAAKPATVAGLQKKPRWKAGK